MLFKLEKSSLLSNLTQEGKELLDELPGTVPYTKGIVDVASKGDVCEEGAIGLENFQLKFLHKNLRYEGTQR